MEQTLPGQQNYFEAFIKAAQYFARLTSQQDIWSEAGKVLVNFFGADVGAVEESRVNGETTKHRWVFSERYSSRRDLEAETREVIAEVWESGFLSTQIIFTPDPLSIACFPITWENQVVAVMVVGHGTPKPLLKELLNVYLAVAGLVGTTSERLASERERRRRRQQLEEEIAEREQAEKALSLFRALIDHTNDAIEVIDPEGGRFLDANKQAYHTLGYTREEFLNLTVHDIDPLTSDPSRQEAFEEFLRTGYHVRESQHRRKDGSIFPVEVTVNYIRMDRDYIIAVVRDITDRKQAEKEIRRLNAELEQRVQDRTAQLEAAVKEIETFSYTVSHNLRAPVRHIDGYLELLQIRTATTLDEQCGQYMAAISDSANYMGQLIDDLLTFLRMGRYELYRQSVDLNALVQEVIREIEPETHGRDIHWRIAPLPTVTGDRTMLRLVLVDLIANALKFTRRRPQVDIEVGCRADTKEAIIFIRDNGVGFDMAYVDKLFGVFQRLHHADEFEGTGIGLANVRRIIQRHGGRTWAEGKVGEGAAFYFSLPLSTDSQG
jgi:PAS domain S-box-containing protein